MTPRDAALLLPKAESRAAAKAGGLRYVSDEAPGITRRRHGRGFAYRRADRGPIRDKETLRRIRALAVPPAWTRVWICVHADGHIQATGRDARGRKQYRYHADWRAVRDAAKYDHLLEFAAALPALRGRIAEDMRRPGLAREKVLATVAHLLDITLIRVGNDDYARQNGTYGLTTLRNRHVEVNGTELRFVFTGKSGRAWRLRIRDRRIAGIIRRCQELPGQHLFQYRDQDGALRDVTSADVNAYLREVTGHDVTAKDFRTWAGTVLAATVLRDFGPQDALTAARRNLVAAIDRVAARLGNTRAICRSCYVHPAVLSGYLEGRLLAQVAGDMAAGPEGLQPEEAAVLAWLGGMADGRQPARAAAA